MVETMRQLRSRRSTTPRLASDILRGFLALGMSAIIALLYPPLVALLAGPQKLTSILVGSLLMWWCMFALLTSILTWVAFRRASGQQLSKWLAATTPTDGIQRVIWMINGGGATSWAIVGSVTAMSAIVVLSTNAEFRTDPLVLIPAISLVVASVSMMISAYAVHYARENTRHGGVGLEFPGRDAPRFVDYYYLSVQVATTFSPSDVMITSSNMRRTVSVHSVISFAFNTVIVALFVSMLVVAIS